jgi:hypothetical protein
MPAPGSGRGDATLRYLPPYSPGLNPIELSYSSFKAFLRKCAERTEQALRRRAGQLKNAAELDSGWLWFARSAMMHALLGPDVPPIGNTEGKKSHRWRTKRKLARDR